MSRDLILGSSRFKVCHLCVSECYPGMKSERRIQIKRENCHKWDWARLQEGGSILYGLAASWEPSAKSPVDKHNGDLEQVL